jgi:hypothetical protein
MWGDVAALILKPARKCSTICTSPNLHRHHYPRFIRMQPLQVARLSELSVISFINLFIMSSSMATQHGFLDVFEVLSKQIFC